jgi:hypothetical protein
MRKLVNDCPFGLLLAFQRTIGGGPETNRDNVLVLIIMPAILPFFEAAAILEKRSHDVEDILISRSSSQCLPQ